MTKRIMMKKLILIAFVVQTAITLLPAQVNLDSLLISYWPFNGNAHDESGNGYDGTVYGAALTTDRFGHENSAFSFDGLDDYIEIDSRFDSISIPLSISAWIYKIDNGVNLGVIFTSHDHQDNYFGTWLSYAPNTKMAISYGDGGSAAPNARRSKISDTIIPFESWTHIAGIIRGPTDMSIYIGGKEVSAFYDGSGGNMQINNLPARIGLKVQQSNFFEGIIDDIRFYNRALTFEEVDSLFHEKNVSSADELSFSKYKLGQNFPNPCNASTSIPYTIQEQGSVSFQIYNSLSSEIQSITETIISPGSYSIKLNTENYPAGIYYYKMEINDFVQIRKMSVVH